MKCVSGPATSAVPLGAAYVTRGPPPNAPYGFRGSADGGSGDKLRGRDVVLVEGIEADGLFDRGHGDSSGEDFGLGFKGDARVERVHRSLAGAVPQGGQVGAGRAGGVDVEVGVGPFVEELPLAVR